MKIFGIAGSNSSKSINEKLTKYALSLVNGIETEYLDIKKLMVPIFGVDLEAEGGVPEEIKNLYAKLREADGLIISVAEHNGNLTVFFKNILDWLSRYEGKYFEGKKVLLLGTSPGKGGAQKAMAMMDRPINYGGAELVASFSLPSFSETTTSEVPFEIKDDNLKAGLIDAVNKLKESLD